MRHVGQERSACWRNCPRNTYNPQAVKLQSIVVVLIELSVPPFDCLVAEEVWEGGVGPVQLWRQSRGRCFCFRRLWSERWVLCMMIEVRHYLHLSIPIQRLIDCDTREVRPHLACSFPGYYYYLLFYKYVNHFSVECTFPHMISSLWGHLMKTFSITPRIKEG